MSNKIGRNDQCSCGSGKKYKKCHLLTDNNKVGFVNVEAEIGLKYKKLFEFNRRLRAVADKIMIKGYPLSSDKAIFTAFCLGKAYKTHKAILMLCEKGYGQDAAMLTRSLIDLLITLLYILKDETDERLLRYFNYDWILRKKMLDYVKSKPAIFKILEERKTNPKTNDGSVEEIEAKVKEVQDKYQYGRDWSDKNLREMAEEIGRGDLYATIYKLQSQVVHTAPRAMNEYVKHDGNEYAIISVGTDEQWVEEALVSGFDCFYNIVGEFDKLLRLGLDKEMDEIAGEYTDELKIG